MWLQSSFQSINQVCGNFLFIGFIAPEEFQLIQSVPQDQLHGAAIDSFGSQPGDLLLSRSSNRFAHSNCTRPMLTIPLVFGHLRLVVAFQRPGDDPDGCLGERLSLDPPLFSGVSARSCAVLRIGP
jgi:hypothetical protein